MVEFGMDEQALDDGGRGPTILDVARTADVSPATVSRVLRGGARVSDLLKQRVMRAVDEVGYSWKATGNAYEMLVAIIVPTLTNPYYVEILRGLELEAQKAGFAVCIYTTERSIDREQRILRLLRGRGFFGVVVCAGEVNAESILANVVNKAPVILVNRRAQHGLSSIEIDYESSMSLAARYLVDMGHRRISVMATVTRALDSEDRKLAGVLKVLGTMEGFAAESSIVATEPTIDGGFRAATALLSRSRTERPTAIMGYNDLVAIGAMHAAASLGLRVPDDVSVIGMDGIELAAHTRPSLTTVTQPTMRLGKVAFETLQAVRENGEAVSVKLFSEGGLVLRESAGAPPHE